MDANNAKRGGGGGSVKSPCQTPRSTDKSNRDLRSADLNSNSFNKSEKEKGVNIQVIVRCRYVTLFFFKKLSSFKLIAPCA